MSVQLLSPFFYSGSFHCWVGHRLCSDTHVQVSWLYDVSFKHHSYWAGGAIITPAPLCRHGHLRQKAALPGHTTCRGRGAQTQFFSYSEWFFLLHTFPETPDPEGNHNSTIKTAIYQCHTLWGPPPQHALGLCSHLLLCAFLLFQCRTLWIEQQRQKGWDLTTVWSFSFLFLAETMIN